MEKYLGLTKTELSRVRLSKRLNIAFVMLEHVIKSGKRGANCDECRISLNLNLTGASTRFSELHQSGLIKSTYIRRKTSSGGSALVYKAIDSVDFNQYIDWVNKPKSSKSVAVDVYQQSVLDLGLKFIKNWKNKHNSPARKKLVLTLVNSLVKLNPDYTK